MSSKLIAVLYSAWIGITILGIYTDGLTHFITIILFYAILLIIMLLNRKLETIITTADTARTTFIFTIDLMVAFTFAFLIHYFLF